jgi:integrase
MSVYTIPGAQKKVYWYRFMHRGQVIRRSTKQGSYKAACDMEAAHKTALAKGDLGIFEKKPSPTLAAFGKEFLKWAKAQFSEKPKTLAFYKNGINRLSEYQPLASLALDDKRIPERLTGYIAKRQTPTTVGEKQRKALQISSINRELQVLRRLLNLAVEWGKIESSPKIKLLSGENHREFVLLPAEEEKYLLAAPKLLADVATVLVDSGLRPEECYRLTWENVSWDNGRFGTFLVTHGKTKSARRVLPMTARVRQILETRWIEAKKPVEGWVWPADTKSEHMEPSTVKKQHRKALKVSKVRPFVLYALRHTFLTRLGQRGCDVWTLARIAGHSSITMSKRYVHPDGNDVLAVLERDEAKISGSHEFGHSDKTTNSESDGGKRLSA